MPPPLSAIQNFISHVDLNGAVLDDLGFPVVVLDDTLMIRYANKAFLKKLKYSKTDVVGSLKYNDIRVSPMLSQELLFHSNGLLSDASSDMRHFIALKDKQGTIHYFFQKTSQSDNFQVLYLFDHSQPLHQMSTHICGEISYKKIFNSFPDIVFVLDHQLRIQEINTGKNAMLLGKRDNIIHRKITELSIPSFLIDLTVKHAKKCMQNHKESRFEYSLVQKSKILHFSCRMIPDAEFIVALIYDITDERDALSRKTEEHQKMADMFNDLPVAVVETDTEGRIQYNNVTFNHLVLSLGCIPSDDLSDYIGSEVFRKIIQQEKQGLGFCAAFGKGYIDITSKSRLSKEGKTHLFTLVDVTERETDKLQLKRQEISFKTLVDSSPSGILIRDFEKVYYANDEALRILGFSHFNEIRLDRVMSDTDLKHINKRLKKVLNGEDVGYSEFIIHPAGEQEKVILQTKPVLIDYEGKRVFQIVFRNISSEKLLLEERLKKQLLEESNQRLLSEIAYRIEIENKLKTTLDENNLLINEVHHRIKNNFQLVSSMLSRSLSDIVDPASAKALRYTRSRLGSLAMVHEFALDEKNFNDISLVGYLRKIYQLHLRESPSLSGGKQIKFNTSIRKLSVKINLATPIGLIFNEILTLVHEHAVQLNDNNCNFVVLKWQNKKTLLFSVHLSRKIAEVFDREIKNGPSFLAIRDFLEQINGHLKCDCGKNELQLIVKL